MKVCSWHVLQPIQGDMHSPTPGNPTPRLDHLANEVNALCYWLQNRLAWVQHQVQVGQLSFYLLARLV